MGHAPPGEGSLKTHNHPHNARGTARTTSQGLTLENGPMALIGRDAERLRVEGLRRECFEQEEFAAACDLFRDPSPGGD